MRDQFCVELVWNREFNWAHFKVTDTLESAVEAAISIRDSGDGARVKKVRVVSSTTGAVLWENGRYL